MYKYYQLLVDVDTDMDFDATFDLRYTNDFTLSRDEGIMKGSFTFKVHVDYHGDEDLAKEHAMIVMANFIEHIEISDHHKAPNNDEFNKSLRKLANEVRCGDLTFKNILSGNHHFNFSFLYKSMEVL